VEALFEIERHLDDIQRFEAQLIERRAEGHGRRHCRSDTLGDHANDLIFHRRHQSISQTVSGSKIMLSAASPGPKAIAHPSPDGDFVSSMLFNTNMIVAEDMLPKKRSTSRE